MKYLIDTHMLIWWQQDAAELSAKARAIMLDDGNTIVVSSITLWEIAIKLALGKLDTDFNEVLRAIDDDGFALLSFTPTHATHVRSLPAIHRDPFDRALIAQALAEQMQFLTHDGLVSSYGAFVELA